MAQIGDTEGEKKAQFASLRPTQSIETITFEEVMDLFKLPRELGEFEGKVVKANIGRFGPYVQHDGKFVSIKEDDPMDIALDRSEEHTSELQSRPHLVCRLLLEKKKQPNRFN